MPIASASRDRQNAWHFDDGALYNLFVDLSIENPWWNEGGLRQDPDLQRLSTALLEHNPRPFHASDCAAPGVYTLRGPRRVGKTVALKLLIAELIEKHGWAPRTISWTAVDTVRTLAQLEERLDAIVRVASPRLLLVDEVTSVAGWQRVVKKLVDDGRLGRTCVILTGSSAHDLKAGAERMAGRRGAAIRPDRVLLPLSFVEFRTQAERRGMVGDLVTDHLVVGGFPFRVEAYLRGARDALEGFQIFDDVVLYEIGRRRLDRSIALEVIGRVAVVATGATSYHAFAKALSVADETARKYLDALGDAFLLATISSYDVGRGRVAPKKDKKLVWIDPALGFLGAHLRTAEPALEATRAEHAVGSALLRAYESRLFEGLSAPRQVFTWKSSSGNEIDYLVVDRSRHLRAPFEVKWQRSLSDWDFQVMERAFGAGTIVTPSVTRARPKGEAVDFATFASRMAIHGSS
jgi:predicted AAA+ superfamily ATPase